MYGNIPRAYTCVYLRDNNIILLKFLWHIFFPLCLTELLCNETITLEVDAKMISRALQSKEH